jgi:hypothetical protein
MPAEGFNALGVSLERKLRCFAGSTIIEAWSVSRIRLSRRLRRRSQIERAAPKSNAFLTLMRKQSRLESNNRPRHLGRVKSPWFLTRETIYREILLHQRHHCETPTY